MDGELKSNGCSSAACEELYTVNRGKMRMAGVSPDWIGAGGIIRTRKVTVNLVVSER
jgi:hypothetical protein